MKHLTQWYALCMLIVTLSLCSADVSAITFPVKSDIYVGAGPLVGNKNFHQDTRPAYGIGFTVGGNFYNVNLEGRVNYGNLHDLEIPEGGVFIKRALDSYPYGCKARDPECHWNYTLVTGYTFHLFQRFSVTPQVGLQWHSGSDLKCNNPRSIGSLRLHYAFNKHWGIANGIESDFKDTWADYLHLVYTF